MASLDMSDAFDVFCAPNEQSGHCRTTDAMHSAGLNSSIEHDERSAEDISKGTGLTVTMNRFSHACASSLFVPSPTRPLPLTP
jgi:hypothetical protein